MRVTPLLGDSDVITLEIEQEVSSEVSNTETESSTDLAIGPVTSTSRTTTRVHVPDRNFLIMSGMIREEKIRSRSGVPCLGGLPVIGSGFSNKSNSSIKSNLMIFIRPQIVDTVEQMKEVTKSQRAFFQERNKKKEPLQYHIDTGLEILNINRSNDRDWGL